MFGRILNTSPNLHHHFCLLPVIQVSVFTDIKNVEISPNEAGLFEDSCFWEGVRGGSNINVTLQNC